MPEETKVLSHEEAASIHRSDIKRDILDHLQEEEVRSMRHLARRIDRDRGDVRKHLRELSYMNVIDLESGKSFGASCKIPVLKHDKVVAEPIV